MTVDEQMPTKVGPYEIDRKIGAGGMGTVYLGKHEETGREAAIKVLPPSLAREEGLIERFNREISAMQKLTNPHVVELFESGVADGIYYYSMEYVEGETLAERLHRDRRLDWQLAIEMSIQICSALKSAHDAGIVHRDLKPSNLLIAPDDTVKLTDFGVAQVFAAGKLTKTGGVIGTVEYMSPEQAQGRRASKQSDLYSLGAVLYVMVTGRPPFRGKTSLEVIQKHKFGRFDRPILYVPEIPHWLDDLICQLLEKEPDKRVADAFVLSRRLQEIINKVALSRQDDTYAIADQQQDLAETVAVENRSAVGAAEPGMGTIMRDVLKAEIEAAQQPSVVSRFFNNIYVLIILLGMLIAGGVWWNRTRSLPPDQMFAAGVAIMEQPESDDWLMARDKYFQSLIETDTDEWAKKVEPYMQRIRIYELKKRFLPKRIAGKAIRPKSEAERILVRGLSLRELGDLARAETTLEALLNLTANQEDSKNIHELAQQILKEIRSERTGESGSNQWLASLLKRAENHLDAGESDQAKKILTGIVTLYADDPSATSSVKQAELLLINIPEQ
jgi:hypothetical protein